MPGSLVCPDQLTTRDSSAEAVVKVLSWSVVVQEETAALAVDLLLLYCHAFFWLRTDPAAAMTARKGSYGTFKAQGCVQT